MAAEHLSRAFDQNVRGWKVLALWIREVDNKYYKCYAVLSLLICFVIYDGLLSLNLLYCPRNLEDFVPEVLFYFTSVVLVFKIHMVVFKNKLILKVFSILDSDEFAGETAEHKEINATFISLYRKAFVMYFWIGHIAFMGYTLIPLLKFIFIGKKLTLSVCKYYFLTDEEKEDKLFFYWCYQSIGNYVHMNYSVHTDTFMPGLIFMGIGQFKALNMRLSNIKSKSKKVKDLRHEKHLEKELVQCLKHYDMIREYCSLIEELFDSAMFVQFGVGALINCVAFIGLLQQPTEGRFFMMLYDVMMTVQIFTPGFAGTQLAHESGLTTSAAYSCDWISRSASFKRSLVLLVERANQAVELTACSMFPLSLATFISIMKGAYSCFTLVRAMNIREENE